MQELNQFPLKKSIGTRKNESRRLWTPALKINSQDLTKAFGDNLSTGSVKSSGGDRPVLARLFFENVTAKVPAPIGDPTLSGEYPLCDKNLCFWLSPSNHNSHNLLSMKNATSKGSIRSSVTRIRPQLHEQHQAVMASVLSALQYIYVSNYAAKSILDDLGPK